ncbi:MAG: zinc-dependent metalloprotease [Planctomycetaceae bacterium]
MKPVHWILLGALCALPVRAEEEAAPKAYPDFAEVTRHMKAQEGLFTLYRYAPDDEARDRETLLCRIPAALLGQDLLFLTSISHGGVYTGWMWGDALVRWELRGKNLLLATPDLRFIEKEDNPITDVVKRTYNRTFLAAVPIVTMADGDPVIDLGPLLKSDLAGLADAGGPDASLSSWTKVKTFPENVLVEVDLAFPGGMGGRTVGVSYGFRKLPALDAYTPRAADDRVGYFLTARSDWTKPTEARDLFERYLHRWQLEKGDASLALSPPKRPITFIIEKTVPVRWRRWVRQGILSWNAAFERIGIHDAIAVQQQTDDNEYKDHDPEDARYNFFRWIVSGSAFAMGPSRVDPRTGQILDADIIMDDSMIRAWMEELNLFAPGGAAKYKAPGFARWLAKNPGRSAGRAVVGEGGEAAEGGRGARSRHACGYAEGLRHQTALVHHALLATAAGKEIPEHFFGEIIRETVAHEVGHTLGLRHNFKGSSWLSLEEIRRRRQETDEPTTASVMDYNPILFFAGDEMAKVRHFTTPAIGPYDLWAIEYGYAVPQESQTEEELLKSIAARCSEAGHDYATDEDTLWVVSPDPQVERWDMSSDAIAWNRARVALCDQALRSLAKWAVRAGESRSWLRQAFEILFFERARTSDLVVKLLGGQAFHRDHLGDPGARAPFVPVTPARQREALRFLGETILHEGFFKIDPALLNDLAPPRWDHWGAFLADRLDYPIHEQIALLQWWTLIDLSSEPLLQRVYDAELKSAAPDRFTAAELIQGTRDLVWRQVMRPGAQPPVAGQPFLTSVGRGLQREYLSLMLDIVRQPPGAMLSPDLHAMMRHALRELSDSLGALLAAEKGLDFASRAHFAESKSLIDRVLDAKYAAH